MTRALGRKRLCQPDCRALRHRSTSSAYMKYEVVKSPTCSKACLRIIRQAPETASTATAPFTVLNNGSVPHKRERGNNRRSNSVSSTSLINEGKERIQLVWTEPSEFSSFGPIIPACSLLSR